MGCQHAHCDAPEMFRTDVPLACKTLVEVADMLRRREVSAVELTQTVLRRIATHDPRLCAYQTQMEESALTEAAVADKEIAELGTTKSPLHVRSRSVPHHH